MCPLLVETRGLQLLKVSDSPLPPICGAQICFSQYLVCFYSADLYKKSMKWWETKIWLPAVPPEQYFWKERSVLNWTWVLVEKPICPGIIISMCSKYSYTKWTKSIITQKKLYLYIYRFKSCWALISKTAEDELSQLEGEECEKCHESHRICRETL